MNDVMHLSAEQLQRAAGVKEQIERLQAQLDSILGTTAPQGNGGAAPKKRRKMSAAGRAAIAAGARARWAKIKGTASPAQKPKRKISAAGRARLAALARARWKKARAAGKHTL
jgi:hypothetical protein